MVLYAMVTGTLPFYSSSQERVIEKIRSGVFVMHSHFSQPLRHLLKSDFSLYLSLSSPLQLFLTLISFLYLPCSHLSQVDAAPLSRPAPFSVCPQLPPVDGRHLPLASSASLSREAGAATGVHGGELQEGGGLSVCTIICSRASGHWTLSATTAPQLGKWNRPCFCTYMFSDDH